MTITVIGTELLATGILVFAFYCVGWMVFDLGRRLTRRARDVVR